MWDNKILHKKMPPLQNQRRNADIARALKIQVHTVAKHVTAILKKLELGSRYEAGQ